jgi:ATP-binding cassette subfamily C protein LapB
MRDFLMEVMHGIVTIRALGAEQQILRRFERLSEQAAAHTRTVVRLADDAQSFSSSVSTLTQIGTATAGAVLAVRGEMSLGVVASSTMLASRVIQPLLRLVSAWNEIQAVMVAEEMMKPILALPARHHDRGEAGIRESGPLALTFDDVWFSYDESGPAVLEGATLDIRPARSSR